VTKSNKLWVSRHCDTEVCLWIPYTYFRVCTSAAFVSVVGVSELQDPLGYAHVLGVTLIR